MIDYQSVQQAIRDGAEIEAIEAMLRDEHARLTDRQIEMLREELSEREED